MRFLIGALLDVQMLRDEDLPGFAPCQRPCNYTMDLVNDMGEYQALGRSLPLELSGTIWTCGPIRDECLPRRTFNVSVQFARSSHAWTCLARRADNRCAPGSVQTRREDSSIAATERLVESATAKALNILRRSR